MQIFPMFHLLRLDSLLTPLDLMKKRNCGQRIRTALSSGSVLVHGFDLICDGKLVARGDYLSGSTIPCRSFINAMDQAIDKDNPLSFHVASKERNYIESTGLLLPLSLLLG